MSNSISYSYRDLWMVAALVCVAVVLWAIFLLTRRKFRFSTPAYLCSSARYLAAAQGNCVARP